VRFFEDEESDAEAEADDADDAETGSGGHSKKKKYIPLYCFNIDMVGCNSKESIRLNVNNEIKSPGFSI
jgi:hypothetical protein